MLERFTERARQVVVLAQDEALSLGHNYIGTEHILLGLVRENEGVAARILLDFDADSEKIRNEVIRMLSGPGGRRQGAAAGAGAGGGSASTSRSSPPRASSTRASDARPRSSGSCRSSRGARRTTPCSSASRVSAR